MNLLCHRGWWEYRVEQNSFAAIQRALNEGLGVETDIRDCDGRLVVSHDPPKQGALPCERLFEAYARGGYNNKLALNIKADGLQERLQAMLIQFGIQNYFVFDMSVPDTLGYLKRGMPVAARLSEYEEGGVLLDRADAVWLDAFEREWYGVDTLTSLLAKGKEICVVSSELHGRPYQPLWELLSGLSTAESARVHLCTDNFVEARRTFHVIKN